MTVQPAGNPALTLQSERPQDAALVEALVARAFGPGRFTKVSGPVLEMPPPVTDRVPQSQESAAWIVRTALCVEPREGRLHVFMPPMENAADYLELIAVIEDSAKAAALRRVFPKPRQAWPKRGHG